MVSAEVPRDALYELGFSPRWQALFAPHAGTDVVPARVVRTDRGSSLVATSDGIVRAKPSAALLKGASGAGVVPAVGDWIALRTSSDLDVPLVEAVLERSSAITRGDPGDAAVVQVLAANIDSVFITHPIAEPPNLRRLERELSLAWDSGAVPVVVLTKADLSEAREAALLAVEGIAVGTDVLLTSARSGAGIDAILAYVADRRTAVFIGPSGAGKSSLVNALLGEERQATREVRVGDGAGRHTTVARELLQLPGGGLLIDTPGLRSLGLTGSDAGIAAAFSDIAVFAEGCRFRDCTHQDEPGCAVRAAVDSGELPVERLDNYHKLLREVEVASAKTDARLKAEVARKWKVISKARKELNQRSDRG